MGCFGNQRTAGGGVLLTQGLSSKFISRAKDTFCSTFASLAFFYFGEQGFFYAPPRLKDRSTTRLPNTSERLSHQNAH